MTEMRAAHCDSVPSSGLSMQEEQTQARDIDHFQLQRRTFADFASHSPLLIERVESL